MFGAFAGFTGTSSTFVLPSLKALVLFDGLVFSLKVGRFTFFKKIDCMSGMLFLLFVQSLFQFGAKEGK